MTGEERVLRTLERKDVDQVPTFEWLIDEKVMNALAPGKNYEEFCYEFDIDAICVDVNYTKEKIADDKIKDEWGMIKKDTGEAHSFPIDGPIRTMEDLEAYTPPSPYSPGRFKDVERAVAEHKGKKAVILHLNDVFSIPSRMMPFDDFMMATVMDPDLVMGLIEMSVDTNLKLAEEAVKKGIKIIYTGDDYAYNTGPMMSPDMFREMFYPGLKKVMQGYKDMGLYVIKHTDGNIMPILDMILDSGIDCLDPIDPIAGMDLASLMEKYGSNVCFKGNVDCAHTLTFKSVEETIAETKYCLDVGMKHKGYFLSSSNSIHSEVKPENYKAMLETVRTYGRY
jgi:uroporphyrinogen decarboxylase